MGEEIRFIDLAGLQPKQLAAWNTLLSKECKYLLFGGAMGGSKSYMLRWASVGFLMYLYGKYKTKYIQVGLFSEDYPTLKDRQITKIKREFPPWLGELKDTKDEGYAFYLSDSYGSGRILLRNLDDPSKYMSTEFAGEFVEELTRNKMQTFNDLRNRLRYPGVEEVKFMGATNPGGVGHGWVRNHFVDKSTDDPEQNRFFYIHANAYDNKYINPTYIKQLESLPEQQRKAFLDGSWDVFEGQVFDEFNRNIHVIRTRPITEKYPHSLGMDWGYSGREGDGAAFAAYSMITKREVFTDMFGDKHHFNRVIVYKEFVGKKKTPDQWAEKIYNNDKKLTAGTADSSMFNPQSDGSTAISKLMENKWDELHGGKWLRLKKGTKNRLSRVAILHNWLSIAPDGLPYLLIMDCCSYIIKTIPELVHDDTKVEDVDTVADDHGYDGLTYRLADIKFIRVDPSVVTPKTKKSAPQGFRPINMHEFEREEEKSGVGVV